jgi:hypothetical protein
MKKKVTVVVTSEIEVDTSCYESSTNKAIEEVETHTYKDWFFDNIKNVKVTVKKV